jgi:type VI secretion system secreted protein VgrG
LPEGQEQTYNPLPGGSVKGTFINRFAVRERVRSTDLSQRDYTFKSPHFDLETGHDAADSGLSASYSLYDYPGRYKAHDVGKAFTRYRLERVRADASTGDGRTNTIHLSAGHKFTLLGHADPAQNVPWRLLSVTHRGTQPQASGAEAGEDGRTVYGAAFTVMPAAALYRPPRRRKPLVDGPQIATVVGPAGEEIYTDEHGRVKVQFPWDRYGTSDEHSSCWVRVSNNWSGGGWGHIAIPRIGHEVIVDFLEGDPDQPIITGRTYHAANRPPYVLPKNKTKMVIRSEPIRARASTRSASRTRPGRNRSTSTPRRTRTSTSRTTAPSGSTSTRPRASGTTNPSRSATTTTRSSAAT